MADASAPAVSVVISTYNRCDLLPKTLRSILQQDAGRVRYEVIVVDNNSTDRTREVLESWKPQGHANLRYLFEGKQGVSHGRNTGISAARAPLIAFIDDDVFAAPDWIARMVQALHENPEADYVGGKVLATAPHEFPSWLTSSHWSPLALQDHGEKAFPVGLERPVCLVTANLGIRREVFARVGGFSPKFPRCQDHELQLRIWRSGGKGLYLPGLVVFTEVPPERLTRRYHRRWHSRHGKFIAMMRPHDVECSTRRFFDVPGHLIRQAGLDLLMLLKQLGSRTETAITAEMRLRFFIGFARRRCRDSLLRSRSGRDP